MSHRFRQLSTAIQVAPWSPGTQEPRRFGISWRWRPFTIGVQVLYAESWSNHGEIAKGTVAAGFATQKLAECCLKIADGLEVVYQQ
eukprot:3841086-Pyramimonas_sp.AAC.1